MSRHARNARLTLETQQAHSDDLDAMQLRISDLSALRYIERDSFPVLIGSLQWLDVRPMMDEREVSLLSIDQARAAVAHGLSRGLLIQHAQQQHLVRIARRPL